MCTVSMVIDHQRDIWTDRYPTIFPEPKPFAPNVTPLFQLPTKQEIEEFRRLLERAREYDRKHNEPNCEMAEKIQALRDLARELGVEDEIVIALKIEDPVNFDGLEDPK